MLRETLKSALSDTGYQDLRYQKIKTVLIRVRNDEVKSVDVIEKEGGHARALIGGGFGSLSFNKLDAAKSSLETCLKFSDLIPGEQKLAGVDPIIDTVHIHAEIDPRDVSLEDKKKLLLDYGKLAASFDNLAICDIEYQEEYSEKYYVNNEGADILQHSMVAGINFRMTSKTEGLTQQTRLSFGGGQDYKNFIGREDEVVAKAKQTVALLEAEAVKAGQYDVVLDPTVGGLFIHEAFGHLSEADNLLNSEGLRNTMALGKVFADKHFNVVDDPSEPGHSGSFIYDDEGTKGKKTYLIKDGKLNGRLHSRMTAGIVGEDATGHCRAKSFEFTPIVRMGNTYIESSTWSKEDIFASVKDGLYLFGTAGGQTSGDMYTFTVQGGYKIKDGQLDGMVRDITLTGNLFETLNNIVMIGDTRIMAEGGGCGKGGQILRANCKGSPFVRINGMSIGGR